MFTGFFLCNFLSYALYEKILNQTEYIFSILFILISDTLNVTFFYKNVHFLHILSFNFLADGFDIVVNDCYAHNGGNKRIQLIDQYGCPVDDKLISRFRGSWSESGLFETQVFAYMKTFRFTGSPALYIECDVRMCHGRCPVSKVTVRREFPLRNDIHDEKPWRQFSTGSPT